jgi:threonine/homoserine/homoserine lactone efflux protein
MSQSAHLWVYFLVISGVIMLPGMDMAFVMGSSVSGGRPVGLAAVAGIVAGGACHLLIAATGISALLMLMPAALVVMLLAGAGYIGWIGWRMLRARGADALAIASGARTPVHGFFGAIATSLLNPKAYIFMLAIFPQFVQASRGSVWAQAGVLGLITASTQIVVYGALALLAGRAQALLAARPAPGAWMAKGVGLVLIGAAALTLYSGFTGLPWRPGGAVA